MATQRPSRAYWDTTATDWVYFEAVAGTGVHHNTSTLVIATDNTNPAAATWYSAIKFDSQTAPNWATVGPISLQGMALLLVVSQIARRSAGIGNVQFASITDPWDDSYSAAQMRGLAIGGWTSLAGGVQNSYGIPQAWLAGATATPANGFMIRVEPGNIATGGTVRMLTNPVPKLRYLYQYTADLSTRSDATERATLTAADIAVIAGYGEYDHFEQESTIKISDKLPAESDIEIGIVGGAAPSLAARTAEWPESWTLDVPSVGGVPFSQVSNTSMANAGGMPVESTLNLVYADGTSVEIMKTIQYAGDIIHANDGTGEIELRSMLDRTFRNEINDYTPYGTSTIEYTDEIWIYIVIDLLINGGAVQYDQVHYNDLTYMLSRFAGVFGTFTYSVADLTDATMADVMADIGPILGLCMTQAADGCVALWHPAVYRESIRVWTIDEGDCTPGGYSMIKRGRDGQYGKISITDTDSGTGLSSQVLKFRPARAPRRAGRYDSQYFEVEYSTTANPSTTSGTGPSQLPSSPGFTEEPYRFTAKGDAFIDYGSARAALIRQLSQRLCNEKWECELTLGLKGLPIDIGDIVQLTGSGLDSSTNFLIMASSIDPTSGNTSVSGVHYPEALALSSTFQDTGIEGEWRWLDETGAQDTANQAPDGSDTDPATVTLATLSYEHWQGVMHEDGYADWAVPLISASLHDVFDLCTMISPEVDGSVANIAGWGDDEYMPIMVWRKATGDEAMAIGFYRPNFSTTPDIVDHQLFIAHIVDYTAATFTFTSVAYSPNGICGRDAGTAAVPASFALQWDDSENVNLYVDRQLVASGASFSKADWTQFRIVTQPDIKTGCFRHIQTDSAITELQRLQGLNGLDCWHP